MPKKEQDSNFPTVDPPQIYAFGPFDRKTINYPNNIAIACQQLKQCKKMNLKLKEKSYTIKYRN